MEEDKKKLRKLCLLCGKYSLNFQATHHTDSSIFFLLDKLIQKIYLLITTHESAHNLSSDTITVTFYQHGVTRVTDFQIIFTTFIAKHFVYTHKYKNLYRLEHSTQRENEN